MSADDLRAVSSQLRRQRAAGMAAGLALLLTVYLGFVLNPVPMGVPFLESAAAVRVALVFLSPGAALIAAVLTSTLVSLFMGGPRVVIADRSVQVRRPPRRLVAFSCSEIVGVGDVCNRRLVLDVLEGDSYFAIEVAGHGRVLIGNIDDRVPVEAVRQRVLDCAVHS